LEAGDASGAGARAGVPVAVDRGEGRRRARRPVPTSG
jgi:hypothetical protein